MREIKYFIHTLKKAIATTTFRKQPNLNLEFILTTDASSFAIGAVLSQINKEGKEEMIYAHSKGLDNAQLNNSVTEKELLAIIKSLEYFRAYLIGKTFTLRTDHKALEYLWNTKNPSSKLLRCSLKIQDFKFKPVYI